MGHCPHAEPSVGLAGACGLAWSMMSSQGACASVWTMTHTSFSLGGPHFIPWADSYWACQRPPQLQQPQPAQPFRAPLAPPSLTMLHHGACFTMGHASRPPLHVPARCYWACRIRCNSLGQLSAADFPKTNHHAHHFHAPPPPHCPARCYWACQRLSQLQQTQAPPTYLSI